MKFHKIINLTAILIIFLIKTCSADFLSSYDLYIDKDSQCNNNCLGNEATPFNHMSTAINFLLNFLNISNLNNNVIINIRLLNDFYICNENEDSDLFYQWEKLLNVNLTINMMPNECYLFENCSGI